MNSDWSKLPPEIAAAYRDGKSRGLPDGWTVEIDKRNRRKWTAPNGGRSCDSIPKALAISVELGLLSKDFKIESGKRKRKPGSTGGAGRPAKSRRIQSAESDIDEEDSYDETEPPPEPLDPEVSLDGLRRASAPTTVHWDPSGVDGRKIGWMIRICTANEEWLDGRIVRYDPYSHKHKIELENGKAVWLWIRNEQHNLRLATRLVWARVKGYAWWPAMVMESNSPDDRKEGQVTVEFFTSREVSHLRDIDDCIRPFSPDELDPIVAKHKKKRSQKAFEDACEEVKIMQQVRNEAAVYYATKAIGMANLQGQDYVGKRIEVYRDDVNYPEGDTVVGRVRQYSMHQQKWLVSFEMSEKTHNKYPAAWIDLEAKGARLKILTTKKKTSFSEEELVPYLFGFRSEEKSEEGAVSEDDRDTILSLLQKERCNGCLEYWRKDDSILSCTVCQGSYHLGCCDPSLSQEAWQKMIKEGKEFVCTRCTQCRGCFQKDIVFGVHPYQPPACLSKSPSEPLNLCLMCQDAYHEERFCPNCAHTWDDVKFDKIRRQIEWSGSKRGRKSVRDRLILQDSSADMMLGSFTGDDERPFETKVDPTYYYPETSEWGYTEVEMLNCDSCKVWVHAGCAGIEEDEYNDISDGKHPIYSKEFLCRMCCRRRAKELISRMQVEDQTLLFAVPVSEKVAPNYHDIIKEPMDLQTMFERADSHEYWNYAWVREMFELMVLNALTFNRPLTRVWNEAQRFYQECLKMFSSLGKGAPPSSYANAIQNNLKNGKTVAKKEQLRVQPDQTIEKKDLVAGTSMATKVTLPKLRESTPDLDSCVPFREVKLNKVDGFYNCWMDSCFTCGSSGAADTMLFCVDCGEAFHSFCAGSPIFSMDVAAIAGWRCPNCKVCEISGEVPPDETRMIYCEMCDRAFCLDLLDPPLQDAPPGLWICGQCVDCRTCGNAGGRSVRFWSREPEKCFECGGCEGVDLPDVHKCRVCSKYLHLEEDRMASCCRCSMPVHAKCDKEAEEDLKCREEAPRSQKAKKEKVDTYVCPPCRGESPDEKMSVEEHSLVDLTEDQIDDVLRDKILEADDEMNESEIRFKLKEEIEWSRKDQWRQEYLEIIKESIKMCVTARTYYGDPRIVVQHSLKNPKISSWTNHRAQRFLVIAKRYKWESNDIDKEPITKLVAFAKLAASFLWVASTAMGYEKNSIVQNERVKRLLVEPTEVEGIINLPNDSLRPIRDSVSLDASSSAVIHDTTKSPPEEEYELSSPLCGWGTGMKISSTGIERWHDSRQCCFCHLRGDDDAGLGGRQRDESTDDSEAIPKLGRLLPMHNGLWVHTNCAIWSSEVYEAQADGIVHAVEKARTRGSQLKCFGCGRSGATVGCNKPNCVLNYHFPCAKLCGALVADNQQIFCKNHRGEAEGLLQTQGGELMKTLLVAPEKKATIDISDSSESELCTRIGSLVVHSIGKIESAVDGFHSETYIMPPGYVATRIFWSMKYPRKRALYFLRITKTEDQKALFSITPADDPSDEVSGHSIGHVYNNFMDRVLSVNKDHFSEGEHLSKLPVARKVRKKAYGLNGPQFFGFGLSEIRNLLEMSPGVEAVVAPLSESSPKYKFCFVQPTIESILDLMRKRAANEAEEALTNTSGCARTEGVSAVARSGGSGRITRALVRSVEEEADSGGGPSLQKNEEKTSADSVRVQTKYKNMKAVDIEVRLATRRSHIHGWGLFTKIDIEKDDPIVEYVGEIIRQPIADKREKAYEISGEGSCYMFRLDLNRIVDATNIGSMARFMNHSCQNNAYAKIISIDNDGVQEKKIVVFANRKINAGEEITYDYKFPVEDGSLKCTCGAPNCIGRLN